MKTHDLARLLLSAPDLPVVTTALGHHHHSEDDAFSHGALRVERISRWGQEAIAIGNGWRASSNCPVLETFQPRRVAADPSLDPDGGK